jgi:aquacobalamin reductase/NAD(P)H-flavin reductase
MNTVNCHVHAISSLTANVYKVLLKPKSEADQNFDFIPGQYLSFVMSDDDKRPFSIASAPNAKYIELQIGAFGADSYPMQVIERIQAAHADNSTITVEMPLGGAGLVKESTRPLLLLAGGTGFSYIKSMFEYLAETQSAREVIVYWGLREQSACYELDKTAATLASLANATFIPVVGDVKSDDDWQGRTGFVHKAAMEDIKNLGDYDIYLAGRFEMVGIVRTDFVEQGASLEHMYADAFAYI